MSGDITTRAQPSGESQAKWKYGLGRHGTRLARSTSLATRSVEHPTSLGWADPARRASLPARTWQAHWRRSRW